MALNDVPQDFKELLKLMNLHNVKYLVVGGYAVGFYGYPRATGDLDIWIEKSSDNANKIIDVLNEFGFGVTNLSPDLFLETDKIIRMGVPPIRIEILTTISGVNFDQCYKNRKIGNINNESVNFISLPDLKENKQASGRYKDLDDLENLP